MRTKGSKQSNKVRWIVKKDGEEHGFPTLIHVADFLNIKLHNVRSWTRKKPYKKKNGCRKKFKGVEIIKKIVSKKKNIEETETETKKE